MHMQGMRMMHHQNWLNSTSRFTTAVISGASHPIMPTSSYCSVASVRTYRAVLELRALINNYDI